MEFPTNAVTVPMEQVPLSDPVASQQPHLPKPKAAKKGFNCHQCRQSGRDLVLSCKNVIKKRHCKKHYCHSCIKNRYFLKLEDLQDIDAWKCFHCQGCCNCSTCRSSKGEKPTGRFGRSGHSKTLVLKASGREIPEEHVSAQILPAADENGSPLQKLCGMETSSSFSPNKIEAEKDDKEMISEETTVEDAEMHCSDQIMFPIEKPKEATLPLGTVLTTVANVEFPPEEVGNALQFLEFSYTFGEFLQMSKGQGESILQDIMGGHDGLKVSSLVEFQILLLKLIGDLEEEYPLIPMDGDESWLNALKNCIHNSEWAPYGLAELDIDSSNGYGMLAPSEKLRILVFLCDRTLETEKLHDWIESQHARFLEMEKAKRAKQAAARKMEKAERAKQAAARKQQKLSQKKLVNNTEEPISPKDGVPVSLDELSKENLVNDTEEPISPKDGVPVSLDELSKENLVNDTEEPISPKDGVPVSLDELSKENLVNGTEEPISPKDDVPVSLDENEATVSETLETNGMVQKYGVYSEVLRSHLVFIDPNGSLYWRLKCYNNSDTLLLQGSESETNPAEQWVSFNEVDTEIIDKHISSQVNDLYHLACRVKSRRRKAPRE